MLRRQMLGAGAALAVTPLMISRAVAQDLAPEKQPMIALGSYCKLTTQVAQERSGATSVQTFAGLKVVEQNAIAEAFGAANSPSLMTQEQSDKLEMLRAADDASFDMMYVDGQIEAHEQGLAIAQDYSASGGDPMAQGAAMIAVPSIETHPVMLRSIRASIA